MLFIFFLFFKIFLIFFAIYFLFSLVRKTPFYPSKIKSLDEIFNKIEIKGKNFIDIGSGDGRIVIWAAERGFNADGIEYNPFLTILSKIKIFFLRLNKKVRIYNKDFFDHSYSDYQIVYMFIYSEQMDKLQNKLFRELKPNSVIISNTFNFSEVKEDRKIGNYYVYYIK